MVTLLISKVNKADQRSAMANTRVETPTPEEQKVLGEVLAAMRAVAFGTITLVVQDQRVVQIERTEKRRLVG